MRTKILSLGLACLLVFSIILLAKDFDKFTPGEAATWLEKHLKSLDYNFRVKQELDKKTNKVDFTFNLQRKVKNMDDVEDFTWEIVTLIGDITSKTSWPSSKIIVLFQGKPFFWAYTKDCRKACKMVYGRMEFITAHLHYFKK